MKFPDFRWKIYYLVVVQSEDLNLHKCFDVRRDVFDLVVACVKFLEKGKTFADFLFNLRDFVVSDV